MARTSSRYVCQECGSVYTKWMGKCENCNAWNKVVEELGDDLPKPALKGRAITFEGLEGEAKAYPRWITPIDEFNHVCGGGLVPGSVLLVGGDPGIGKSTLLLQVSAALSQNISSVYISGEEAVDQVRLRAKRLGLEKAPVQLASATQLKDIVTTLDQPSTAKKAPQVVIIDSIQTMQWDALDSAPGTVSQVRACAQELIRLAKKRGICIILVGHVTKEGAIAGPRVLEHMVDAVLYFEGERGHQFRILRSVKNRFGATDEIGVFEMTDRGLMEVANPSQLFLCQRDEGISGTSVFAGMEGTRPVLVEIQALVAPSPLGMPRRAVVGWDSNRLSMILAVLEARCGISIGVQDVYLSVTGGLKIVEPAADLAVASALISAMSHMPLPPHSIFFGEIGLSGEVRTVAHQDIRLKEAAKLGFKRAFVPRPMKKEQSVSQDALALTPLRHIQDLAQLMLPQKARKGQTA